MECHRCGKVGHVKRACFAGARPRSHSWSDNRSGLTRPRNPQAESNSVEAGAATCWGYDAAWVKSVIDLRIHNDVAEALQAEARASAVTALIPDNEDDDDLVGNLG